MPNISWPAHLPIRGLVTSNNNHNLITPAMDIINVMIAMCPHAWENVSTTGAMTSARKSNTVLNKASTELIPAM